MSSELGAHDNDVVGFHKPQNVAGDFLYEVWVRLGRREQRNVSFELGPDGLKASRFERQEGGAFDQSRARLEAVPAMHRMVAEVGHQTKAEDDNHGLPQLRPPSVVRLTQHDATHIRRKRYVRDNTASVLSSGKMTANSVCCRIRLRISGKTRK